MKIFISFQPLHFLNFASEILLHFISSRINVSVCLNLQLSSARGLSFQPHYLMLLKTKTLLRKPVKMKKRWNCELCPYKWMGLFPFLFVNFNLKGIIKSNSSQFLQTQLWMFSKIMFFVDFNNNPYVFIVSQRICSIS